MTTTKAAKMTNLLESCQGTAEFLQLVSGALRNLFAENCEEDPQELTTLLAHLSDAEEAAQALDNATA